MASPKKSQWSYGNRKSSNFKRTHSGKSGCRHFMTTRNVEENWLESYCIYCGITINYPTIDNRSQRRRARVEAEMEKQNMGIKKSKSNNSKGD